MEDDQLPEGMRDATEWKWVSFTTKTLNEGMFAIDLRDARRGKPAIASVFIESGAGQALRCEPPRQATEQHLGKDDPQAQAACQSLLSYPFNNGNGPMPSARRGNQGGRRVVRPGAGA